MNEIIALINSKDFNAFKFCYVLETIPYNSVQEILESYNEVDDDVVHHEFRLILILNDSIALWNPEWSERYIIYFKDNEFSMEYLRDCSISNKNTGIRARCIASQSFGNELK